MNNYCFPHAFDENGYPRIDREMTPEDYNEYRKVTDEIYKTLYNREELRLVRELSIGSYNFANVDLDRLTLVPQDSEDLKNIFYPISGELVDQWNCETVQTHGIFQIITYAVLNYFGRVVSIEDLTKIAVYGGWHHKNGTWWHYIDVICQAYGLKVLRESSWKEVYEKLSIGNFLAVALLDHEMFPEITGNSLVLITKIDGGKIEFFHPKKGIRLCRKYIGNFAAYTRVLWGITG